MKAIRDAAAGTVRAARTRIDANSAVLQRWRTGETSPGSPEWAVGELLDVLARTGDLAALRGEQ